MAARTLAPMNNTFSVQMHHFDMPKFSVAFYHGLNQHLGSGSSGMYENSVSGLDKFNGLSG
jgi:hypothetical protein